MILRKALVSKAWSHFGRRVRGCVSTSLCSGIWKCTHAWRLYLACFAHCYVYWPTLYVQAVQYYIEGIWKCTDTAYDILVYLPGACTWHVSTSRCRAPLHLHFYICFCLRQNYDVCHHHMFPWHYRNIVWAFPEDWFCHDTTRSLCCFFHSSR